MYKNSNKGIKGRGKDRRIFSITQGQGEIKQEKTAGSPSTSMSSDEPNRLFNGTRREDTSGLDFDESDQHSTLGNWAG